MKLTGWWSWARRRLRRTEPREPAIGLALGGGFARAIAHIGVLRVFEQNRIPLKYIAGVSAGSIVAAAFASGRSADEIAGFAGHMRFRDVARWTLSRMGLMDSDRMETFLKKLLNVYTFEQMRIPLAVVATDLTAAKPVVFRDRGEVFVPIRASCAYPGLFRPIRYEGRYLVDGAITMEIPSLPLRQMGATHVVAVVLPMQTPLVDPQNLFRVVNQCFQILQARTEWEWRRHSDVVIVPEVGAANWDSFQDSEKLIEAGERAARAALPTILSWLARPRAAPAYSQPAATRP